MAQFTIVRLAYILSAAIGACRLALAEIWRIKQTAAISTDVQKLKPLFPN